MPDDTVGAYARLIDLCDVHKLRVGIVASKETHRTPRSEMYREFDAVTVTVGAGAGGVTLRERVNGDLEHCAGRLLSRLRCMPRFAGS